MLVIGFLVYVHVIFTELTVCELIHVLYVDNMNVHSSPKKLKLIPVYMYMYVNVRGVLIFRECIL